MRRWLAGVYKHPSNAKREGKINNFLSGMLPIIFILNYIFDRSPESY